MERFDLNKIRSNISYLFRNQLILMTHFENNSYNRMEYDYLYISRNGSDQSLAIVINKTGQGSSTKSL